MRAPVFLVVWFCVVSIGCPASEPAEPQDSGTDGARDAHVDPDLDSGVDASGESTDAGFDAGFDSGFDAGIDHVGDPVGSPCAIAYDCRSPTSPACLTALRPLEPLRGMGDPSVVDQFVDLGEDLPGGYCSSVMNCDADADCGAGGECYRPFADVFDDSWDLLEITLTTPPGSLRYLNDWGVCLKTCDDRGDCRDGYECRIPMAEFASLIPGSNNNQPFCLAAPPPAPPETIGGSCEDASDCSVPGTATCLTEVHPFAGLVAPTDFAATLGIDFERGYCSNEPNCDVDADCGANGGCFRPFTDVTAQTWMDLEDAIGGAIAPFDVLGELGICLLTCGSNLDCRSDQVCAPPMADVVSQVPDSHNVREFCVPHRDCRYCDANAVCVEDGAGNADCVCRPGFSGNGATCTEI